MSSLRHAKHETWGEVFSLRAEYDWLRVGDWTSTISYSFFATYNDDLPYYTSVGGRPWLVVPYAADTNDAGYMNNLGFGTPQRFYEYLVASFDRLWEEGERVPKLLSIGLHCRISGRPGRATAVDRFIRYAKERGQVWFARRDEIARFWLEHMPAGNAPG